MPSPAVHRSIPRPPRAHSLAVALACASLLFAASPAAAAAAHRARLSADLADHLAAGSQTIRVIVHGTRAEVDALAQRYNLTIAKYLQSGAVFVVNAGQLAAMQQDDSQDHLSGDVRIKSSVDAAGVESIGADQVWAGSPRRDGADGQGDHGRGDRLGDRHAAQRAQGPGAGDARLHRRRRLGSVRPRDARGGDHRRPGGQDGRHARLPRHRAGRVPAQPARARRRRVGDGERRDRGDRLDDRRTARTTTCGSSTCRWARRCCSRTATIRCARRSSARCAPGWSWWRRRATTARRRTAGRCTAAIASPANSPYAIAVGALDTHGTAQRSDDTLAAYSSKGPTRYDLIMKPDLAAPGSRIPSAEAAGSYLSTTYPGRHVSGTGADAIMQLSGTSMAAGFVSGAAALVLDARGSLTPRQAKAALQVTSTFMPKAGLVGAGAGMINALAAVELAQTNQIPSSTTIGGEKVHRKPPLLGSSVIETSRVGNFNRVRNQKG